MIRQHDPCMRPRTWQALLLSTTRIEQGRVHCRHEIRLPSDIFPPQQQMRLELKLNVDHEPFLYLPFKSSVRYLHKQYCAIEQYLKWIFFFPLSTSSGTHLVNQRNEQIKKMFYSAFQTTLILPAGLSDWTVKYAIFLADNADCRARQSTYATLLDLLRMTTYIYTQRLRGCTWYQVVNVWWPR